MSLTESQYGERFFDLDRAMSNKLDKENAQKQYKWDIKENGGNETFEEWFEAGNYDPNEWGPYPDETKSK